MRSSLLLKETLIGWQVRVPEYVLYLWKLSQKRKLEPAEETMSLKGDPSLSQVRKYRGPFSSGMLE